ncbi:MAG: protein kinase [Acidobacteria bacterium]|nr:protein kinase [Acidobacteriota bacterium]
MTRAEPIGTGSPSRGNNAAHQPDDTGEFQIGQLHPGSVLGGRFEILQILGQGAMGAVYKARDKELDRFVALKVIRPELANRREILDRFKQELILARQITHRSVVRIFDVGVADGTRFITMEFVDGRDLQSLMASGVKKSLEEKVNIIQQVCEALDAAHAEGVVHRDLKPQNIMVNDSGRAVVMDFGIARSMEQAGATSTGAIIGTPAYMSPEQAKGEKADTRSDLFSLGVIFYELVTNKKPYVSDTVVGLLLKRIQERPVPPIQCGTGIPRTLNDIILQCMAIEPAERYQTAKEVLRDLQSWQTPNIADETVFATSVVDMPAAAPKRTERRWNWKSTAAGAAALALMAAGGYFVRDRLRPAPAAPLAPVTVMIAEFANQTGDPVFDGTLEPVFKLALEGAGFINAYDRTQLRSLGAKLDHPGDKLDEQTARRIAVNQGLGVVVSGTLDRRGNGYTLTVKASQAVTGNAVTTTSANASRKDQVLAAATEAAASIRQAVGDATASESAQRFAMETLSATSLEAVHEYSQAMEAVSNGKYNQALGAFTKAAELDPNFGIAYTGMSVASRTLGRYEDAEKYVQLALRHVDRMTERERYRTRGHYYLLKGNHQKCVEEYSALIGRYPADITALNNLALCSSHLRDMKRAVAEMRKAVGLLPKRLIYRVNLSLYSSYGGDFETGDKEAVAAQQISASLPQVFIALAFAQLGKGQAPRAAETYKLLEKTGAAGASFAASGLADLAFYEGRFSDAVRLLEEGAQTDLADKEPERAAGKFAALADVQLARGQNGAAAGAAEKALANSKAVKVQFLAARVLAATGDAAKARTLTAGLAAEQQGEPQAYAKLLEGDAALRAGDPRKAVQLMTEANRLADTWIGHFDLGRAYLEAGAFAESDSEFDRCIRRRGEALALFLDEIPTYGYFPPVYYYLGRVREGLKSSGFADSYRTYLNIRGSANEDPRLPEVRRRAGG